MFATPTAWALRRHHAMGTELWPLNGPILVLGSAIDNDLRLTTSLTQTENTLPDYALRLTLYSSGWRAESIHQGWTFEHNGHMVEKADLHSGDRLVLNGEAWVVEPTVAMVSGPTVTDFALPLHSGDPAHRILSVLQKLHLAIGAETEIQPILKGLLNALVELLQASEAFAFSLDPTGKPQLVVGTREGATAKLFSDSVVQAALKNGQPLLIPNALTDPLFSASESISTLRLRSVICCPVVVAGRSLGLFYVGSNSADRSFTPEDRDTLALFATLAGSLLHHVAFIDQQGRLLRAMHTDYAEAGILGTSEALRLSLEDATLLAPSQLNILLQGETGTGKELFAHLLHRKSLRHSQPFLALNCSTLRGEMLAGELFGYRRGAFTGAVRDYRGLFLAAHGGTLFLDEVGELDFTLQASLLRVLETRKVKPLGQAHEEDADVRIVCATHRNLADAVAKGLFREDLYFRIAQHTLRVPPLRERGSDVILLAYHFLEKAKAQNPGKLICDFSSDSLGRMLVYRWPGNVRELQNVVLKGAVLTRTSLVTLDFPAPVASWLTLEEATLGFQDEYLAKALSLCSGDKEHAAQMLGISRATLFRRIAKVGV